MLPVRSSLAVNIKKLCRNVLVVLQVEELKSSAPLVIISCDFLNVLGVETRVGKSSSCSKKNRMKKRYNNILRASSSSSSLITNIQS